MSDPGIAAQVRPRRLVRVAVNGTTDTRVQSTLQDFERLSAAFFAELERKFL
jgi:hypothetical protein